MRVFMAGVLGLLGVLMLVAGVHGKGPQLFTALTGSPAPSPSSADGGGVTGHASPAPALPGSGTAPGGLPLVPTGPVISA